MRVVISATFTSESLGKPLSYLLSEAGMPAELDFAPYSQVFQQLLDPGSLMASNREGVNVILARLEDWGTSAKGSYGTLELDSPVCQEEIERNARDFVEALKAFAGRSPAPLIFCLCHPSKAVVEDVEGARFFERVSERVTSELEGMSNLYLVTREQIDEVYPVEDYDDPAGNKLAHVPYKLAYFSALGGILARKIYRIKSARHKVVVLDCDQTLWKGVCGEVGPEGVELDAPRLALQEFMLAQHRTGMVLCLCSKNNEEDALQVFERRTEMPLKLEHIVSWRINWGNKSENIRSLAQELQLGLDSFIFVDDDPVVCAEAMANCPEVLTLQLPQEVETIPRFLRNVWAFDHLKITREDEQRSQLYKQNAERERLRQGSQSFDDFIASLGLEIEISLMKPEHIARVSQLTHRTNQFNFTTIRRSESDIEHLCREGGGECFVVDVRDRFGDYGLVGAVHLPRGGVGLGG